METLGREAVDVWEDGRALARFVYEKFEYNPVTTKVNTNMIEALELRQGVCQDFAHVVLGLSRALGIPARYVSGYFLNTDRVPGQPEASHAWVEFFLPGFGWKGYDPTHDRVADERYVKLAVGRDYADIRPLAGSYRGTGNRVMTVEVHVDPVDENEPAGINQQAR